MLMILPAWVSASDPVTVQDTLAGQAEKREIADSRAKELEEKWDEIDPKWEKEKGSSSFSTGWDWNGFKGLEMGDTLIALVAIVFTFGMPVFIVLIVFLFRYFNRRAKYRIAEKALATGQPIPEGLFKGGNPDTDLTEKGIKNICVGLGLFIFLWVVTGRFGVGSIGLLVLFTGVGEYLIARSRNSDRRRRGE